MKNIKKIFVFITILCSVSIVQANGFTDLIKDALTGSGTFYSSEKVNQAIIGMILSGTPAAYALYQTYKNASAALEDYEKGNKTLLRNSIKTAVSMVGFGISSFIFYYALRQYVNPRVFSDR